MRTWGAAIAIGLVLFTLDPPWWVLLPLAPTAIVLQIWYALTANHAAMVAPEQLPVAGFEELAERLDAGEAEWLDRGFRRTNALAIRSTPPVVVYLYAHETEPHCLARSGSRSITTDFVSEFEGGFELTTSDAAQAGGFPRMRHSAAQYFPEADGDELLRQHKAAHAFVVSMGAVPVDLREADLVDRLVGFLRRQHAHWKEHFLWPARAVVWATSHSGIQKRRKPLEAQHAAGDLPGFAELPNARFRG